MQRPPTDQTPGDAGRAATPHWYAGPPFSEQLFRHAVERAGGAMLPLLEPGGVNDLDAVAKRIAARVDAAAGPVVLVGHGLAVPAVTRAAELAGPNLRHLALSNGPITRLDPFTRAFLRAGPAVSAVLHPALFLRWLASSAGLRRAVCNPYIMDRDTIDAICRPLVASPGGRAAVAAYLRALCPLPTFVAPRVPTTLAWGDDDPLYPLAEADTADAIVGGGRVRAIPGGRYVHPEERPWALADLVLQACATAGEPAP